METTLLAEIERVLRDAKVAPSRFGRMVMHDPRLVFDLRRGRRLTAGNLQRVRCALRELSGEA